MGSSAIACIRLARQRVRAVCVARVSPILQRMPSFPAAGRTQNGAPRHPTSGNLKPRGGPALWGGHLESGANTEG